MGVVRLVVIVTRHVKGGIPVVGLMEYMVPSGRLSMVSETGWVYGPDGYTFTVNDTESD